MTTERSISPGENPGQFRSEAKIKLVCGSSHRALGEKIAAYLGLELSLVKISNFSSGETYARIEETIRGYDTYVIQTAGENVNNDYMELFVIMDALKRSSAASVNVVIPHFGYARQDKKSAPREPISARLIADLLSAVGFNRLVTVDLHADQIQGFFNTPVDHLTALPLFADYFGKKNLPNAVVVAPDTGRAKYAKKLGDKIFADLAIMHKTRPDHNVAEITNVVGDVKGKTVILVDDMIDTAGSVTSGISALRKLGCNSDIYLAATHAVFSGPAITRLKDAGFKEVVVTDTINVSPAKHFEGLKVLSTAPLLGEAIRRNFEKQSISSLFY